MDNNLPGPDHRYAIEPNELKQMVDAVRNTEGMLGDAYKTIHPAEEELYLFAKRSYKQPKTSPR
ncbi:MAG: N-acetylneuraminate synthase family protein [Candidatus Obscuribacter sp.]|nr:N-acetylneuraminate synthase family protein [Candidatus Obscuribacter sp.]